jgi:hypothetical protein
MTTPTPLPRLCPGGTVVCLGCGPSLTQADVDYVRGKATVIAINDAHRLAPWADVLYACDSKWWYWHQGVPSFAGIKVGLNPGISRYFKDITILRNAGKSGLEMDPTGLREGRNSGYQAINLAVHLGASRFVLLGYDMQGAHFHHGHPDGSTPPFLICLQRFATLVEPLKEIGVEVINCSRQTAVTCFPCRPLEEVFA